MHENNFDDVLSNMFFLNLKSFHLKLIYDSWAISSYVIS